MEGPCKKAPVEAITITNNPEDEVSFIEFLFLRGHHCSEEIINSP